MKMYKNQKMKRGLKHLEEEHCIGLVVLWWLHTERWMKRQRGSKHFEDASRSVHRQCQEKNPPCVSHLLTTSTFTEWGGTLREIKWKRKTLFLQRTYNVLEPTSTNTTSTSAWSLRNSWMQYITLTLPCLDPGRQGPEREEHTGWAVAEVKGQGLRTSPSCAKKRVVARTAFCLHFNLFVHHEIAKTWGLQEDTSSGLKWSSHTSKIKTTSYGFFKNNVHICHRGYASRSEVT